MCGIAGWVDFDSRPDTSPRAEVLNRMAAAMAHRGPDDQGVYVNGMAGLAARRLAIVDLAGGHQPLANEDATVWVAFNGEIYNHAALRDRLTALGHRFATRCDTEVLVHAYEQYGPAGMLDHFEGQFAFAIWDAPRRRLMAARDRMGVRPLYWFRRGGLFQCASEIKVLLAGGHLTARPDVRGLDHFVHFLFLIHTRTMFEGVSALPAGHYLLADADGVRVQPWWDLAYPPASADRPVGDRELANLADELQHRLTAAVTLRTRTEVPFAAYLSGGVDSSLIAKLVNEASTTPVATFTARFRRRLFNEANQAEAYAARLGSLSTLVDCRREVLAGAYPHVVRHAETPVLDTSCAAVYALAGAVRQAGYKVVLTGEGADEALAGYIYFKIEKLRRRLHAGPLGWLAPTLAALQMRALGTSYLFPDAEQIAIANKAFGFVPDRWDEFWFLRRLRGLLSPAVLAELGDFTAFDDVPPHWRTATAGRHPLNQSLYLAYRMRLAGALMTEKGDRMSMAHGVEGRYPFLDTELVNFCAGLPTAAKLRGWREKYLLRLVAERHLPASVAWRKKKMLMAPFSETFLERGGEHPPLADDLLSPRAVADAGLLDPQKIADLVVAYPHIRGGTPEGIVVDLGLVFAAAVQTWHRTFFS